jgi:hypothetical protein
VQKAAKALYEAARDVFEHVRVTAQRLVELFVEAVARVLAWVDEHKAYLFLMAAVAAGAIALSAALNLWGLVELEKLVHAAVGAPLVAGLADAGGKAAERFKTLAERWRVDENEKQKIEEIINEVINAPLKGERLFSKLTRLENLSPPLAELRKALKHVKGEVDKDAAVVAALVLYKTLVKNAEAIGEWAGWYKWARGLVERQVFTVTAEEVKRLRGSHRRLEEVAEEVIEELNRVLVLYSQSDFYKERPDLLDKLKQLLEVDLGEAEGLAEARSDELSEFGGVNMGTRVYAALLSVARGGIYGHIATLFMGEGALADIVMSAPVTAYEKARKIAGARGETVDPSRSRRRAKAGGIAGGRGGAVDLPHVKAADWGDRAASVLLRFLIGYGEIDPRLLSGAGEVSLKFRLVEKDGKKDDEKKRVEGGVERGFQVFRAYGGVEAPVGELWIGDVAYFKIGKEELRRLVEEARKTAPDLSGMDTSRQYVEWRATDVTTVKRQIVAGTVHSWQLRWYFGLLGEPKSFSGSASVTKEGIKLFVTAYWPRESENQILKKSSWLESLLGRTVNNWRELVDAINWSWVLKRVEELIGALKPWIGPESANDAEREGLVRRMLGELELLANFAEARKVKDDGEMGKEGAKRLSRAVEALSGGRIKGDHAKGLAQAIILYAEGHKKEAEGLIESLAREAGVSREEVWGIVDFVLSDMYCLVRDCARDAVVRKFVEPALELVMLDKALRGEFSREKALFIFGEIYATAVAGDGTVGRRSVMLAVGGELGGGAALLRLATLHLFNQLLPDGLKFGVRTYVDGGRYYYIAAHGENATKLKRFLAVTAPSAGGGYLSEKFKKFMKDARVDVRLDNIRLTPSGLVAADLTISEGGAAVKYYLYLQNSILLDFQSTDRSRAELAARLLRLAGVSAEVSKAGNRGVWHVVATTDMLAAGREELRNALAEIVRKAVERGWMDEKKAEFWLKKLERGRTVREGLPKYLVRLDKGALEVTFGSPNPNSITRETQRLKEMGLVEDWHFTVKMPEEDRNGYLYIPMEGLAYAAWLSVKGSEKQRELATKFVSYILERAREEGEDVYRKALEVVEEGRARGSLTLKGFEKKVEVEGREYVVKVIGGEAVEEDRGGRKLLRMRITAEVGRVEGEHRIVDRVVREYKITYGRYGADNAAVGYAVAKASAPGGREADAERFSALIEALTGRRPGVYRTRDGKIKMMCYGEHLEDFRRYAELTDAIEEWLRKTRR